MTFPPVRLVLCLALTSPAASDVLGQEQSRKKLPAMPEGVRLERDIVYANHDGIDLMLDLYIPKDASIDQPLPVIAWIHGGGWAKGSKNRCRAVYLAQHGFAVISIGYRLTDVVQWPGQIEDCYAALRWVRESARDRGFDGNRIGVWGSSAGGHLAALVGTRPAADETISSRAQAVCDWFGPTDLLTMPPNVVSENRTYEQVSQSNGAKLLGTTVLEVPGLAKDASALYQVSPDDPPFLIMHGAKDTGVPLSQSERLHGALEAAGVDSTLVILPEGGHGGPEFQTNEVRDTVRRFFERILKEGT
ncbi:MAG: alpha/beta hydrolase [Verrucomicrobiota bacterium]